ncbi:hypothetical protein D3C84_781750 [compost metagenome]
MNGSKVALASMPPVLVSSVKPMIEVTAVPLTTCTENPTVGATAMRRAWGRITWRNCSSGFSARLDEASH